MAPCWINLMLDSLTLAPVHSKNESPLFFFSITTSSGKPKPAEDTRQQPGNISVSLSYTVFILYVKKKNNSGYYSFDTPDRSRWRPSFYLLQWRSLVWRWCCWHCKTLVEQWPCRPRDTSPRLRLALCETGHKTHGFRWFCWLMWSTVSKYTDSFYTDMFKLWKVLIITSPNKKWLRWEVTQVIGQLVISGKMTLPDV